MNEDKKTIKNYVVYDTTIGDMIRYVNEHKDSYSPVDDLVYEHKCPDRCKDDKERILQRENSWRGRVSTNLYLRDDDIFKLAEDITKKLLDEKYKGVLYAKIKEEIYDTSISACAEMVQRANGYVDMSTYPVIDRENKKDVEYLTDIKKFEDMLDKCDLSTYSGGEMVKIHFESLTVKITTYYYEDTIEKKIDRAIRKYIREHLTYCLKKGQLIVPDEYLDKGEKGIEEWRELKGSQNKNNSIEKKLVKELIIQKKQYAYSCNKKVEGTMISANPNRWDIPRMTVDGYWNVSKNTKLMLELVRTKDRQAILKMDNKEILEKYKAYWKNILEQAIRDIDKLTEEDIAK